MKHINCECYICKFGMKAAKEFERKAIEKYGFYIHFVPGDCACPNHINIHTHGIAEVFGHMDLQICLPLTEGQALPILHNAVNMIKEGEVFEPGRKYSGIAENYNIEFIEAIETNRRVLRMLLPNKHGNYAGVIYAAQKSLLHHK